MRSKGYYYLQYNIKCYIIYSVIHGVGLKRLFIETTVFKKMLDDINIPVMEKIIKDEILKNPSAGKIIEGTGGVRKIRIANPHNRQGKSGAYRVLYLDLEWNEVTYLLLIYAKNVQENITSDQKKNIKKIVEAIKNEYQKKKS